MATPAREAAAGSLRRGPPAGPERYALTRPCDWADNTDQSDCQDIALALLSPDPTETIEANDPMLPRENIDPMLPIDPMDPTLATDRIDPRDATDRIEWVDRQDAIDPESSRESPTRTP